MRRIIYSLLSLLMLSASCTAQTGILKVSGKLAGLGDSVRVEVCYPEDMDNPETSYFAQKNGNLDVAVELKKAAFVFIRDQKNPRVYFSFRAVPGESAVIEGDLQESYYFSGSKFFTQYGNADRANDKLLEPAKLLNDECMAMQKKGVPNDSIEKYYESKAEGMHKAYIDGVVDYLKAHSTEEGAWAYYLAMMGYDDLLTAQKTMSPEVQNGRLKPLTDYVINMYKAQKEKEEDAAKIQASGAVAPAFTLNDLNGKPLSLASLKGKYVVLDFWGSWCIWCIRGIPKMKEYYAKYSDKMEILSIDCNDTEEAWKAAVKKYDMPWKHVYNPKGGTITDDYAIQGFPTKIIVDPEGKIVKTIVGEDPAFYELLDKMFQK